MIEKLKELARTIKNRTDGLDDGITVREAKALLLAAESLAALLQAYIYVSEKSD